MATSTLVDVPGIFPLLSLGIHRRKSSASNSQSKKRMVLHRAAYPLHTEYIHYSVLHVVVAFKYDNKLSDSIEYDFNMRYIFIYIVACQAVPIHVF